MDNMTSQYKKILKDLEKNIKDKEDFEYVKNQMTNLFMIFFNEIDNLKELYEEKVDTILARQSAVEDKINKMEGTLKNIEKDIYLDEEETADFEIVCPYCNNEFIIEMDELKDEVQCPECKNMIELDWNDDDCCDDEYSGCHGHCKDEHDDDDM